MPVSNHTASAQITALTTAAGAQYLALFTGSPGAAANQGSEVTGGSYARVALTPSDWTAPSGSGRLSASYTASTSFATATADWGTVSWLAVFDSGSSGNMLWAAPADAAMNIANGDTVTVPAGALAIAIDTGFEV